MINIHEMVDNGFQYSTVDVYPKIEIIPSIAELILKIHNTNNIPPNSIKISQYATDMKHGKFQYNGDSLRFSIRGVLLDGQNRLMACVESGCSFEANIIVGLPDEVFSTIDSGRTRTGGNILARNNSLSAYPANALCHAVRLILKHERGFSLSTSSSTKRSKAESTLDEVQSYINQNVEIFSQLEYAINEFGRGSLLSLPRILFLLHLGCKFHEQYTRKYLKKLVHGEMLEKEETLNLFRNRLISIKAKSTKWTAAEINQTMIKVWNSIGRNGRRSIIHESNLKARRDDPTFFMQKPCNETINEFLELYSSE